MVASNLTSKLKLYHRKSTYDRNLIAVEYRPQERINDLFNSISISFSPLICSSLKYERVTGENLLLIF